MGSRNPFTRLQRNLCGRRAGQVRDRCTLTHRAQSAVKYAMAGNCDGICDVSLTHPPRTIFLVCCYLAVIRCLVVIAGPSGDGGKLYRCDY